MAHPGRRSGADPVGARPSGLDTPDVLRPPGGASRPAALYLFIGNRTFTRTSNSFVLTVIVPSAGSTTGGG
jgi:hypothetical protein